jgi:hypothetical protein
MCYLIFNDHSFFSGFPPIYFVSCLVTKQAKDSYHNTTTHKNELDITMLLLYLFYLDKTKQNR